MKLSANQLPSHLQKKLLPCYLVSGDEVLIANEALDAIRAAAKAQGYGSRELMVQTSGFDWGDLDRASGSLSLFAEKRIVELQLPTGKPGTKGSAAICEFVRRAGDDLLFIVSAPKIAKQGLKSKWVSALEASGVILQIWPVAIRDLPAWINERMKRVGLQPARDAVCLIADRVEGNLLAAQQEIEKLRMLHGEGPLSAAEADAAVANSSRFDVYKLVDAAVSGNASRAIRILEGVRTEGVDAVIVMWALTRELRMLAGLSDGVRTGTSLSEGMQKERIWQSRQALVRACIGRHRASDFYELLQLARRADAAAKGQRREDPWQLATRIVLQLSGPASRAA